MKRVFLAALLLLGSNVQAERVLTPLEHQQAIVVKPNENIVVKLPAAPSTGYQWFFDKPSSDAVKQVQSQQFIPWNKHDIASSGDSIWRFAAQQTGEATLTFSYRKISDGLGIAPLDTRSYTVIVSKTRNDSELAANYKLASAK
jgi:predicted secreted protein